MATTTFLPQLGTKFHDRFVIRELVGLGPIAGVYRATDTALQKEVILKVFYPGLANAKVRDTNLFRIFRARAFLHKNILTVQEVFSGDDYLFVTKDIVEGVSLRTLQALKREALEPFAKREIANLVFEMCEALKMVHMLGANGNLKPENILLSDKGLRIDDPFFLVGRAGVPPEHGAFPFADRYLAPEQLQDEMQERKESDIYALALIVGEVLVGKPVKPGVPLSDQGPFFSPELDDMYLKATATDPGSRFTSVALFWETIRSVFRLPAEEFGPGRSPSAFLPEGYAQRAKAAPVPQESFPFAPTQTTIFQAVVLPQGAVPEAMAQGPVMPPPAKPVEAPAPVVQPPAAPVVEPVTAPVVVEEVVLAAAEPPVAPVVEPVAAPVIVEEVVLATAEPPVAPVVEPVAAPVVQAAPVKEEPVEVPEILETEPMPAAPVQQEEEPPLLLEEKPVEADEEAELMALLEAEAAAEAAETLKRSSSEPVIRLDAEPELDMALHIPAGPHSHEALHLEQDIPPEIPGVPAGASADASVLREIERIIEESRELDSVVEAAGHSRLVEEMTSGAPVTPEMKVEAEAVVAEAEIHEGGEVDEAEMAELAEGEELEGELVEAEEEELPAELAEEAPALVEEEPVREPVPPPASIAPEKGYRRDLEFWRLRNVEEDSDLEELIGASHKGRADEEEELLVLGDSRSKKREEAGQPALVDLSAPVSEARAEAKAGKQGKEKKGKNGKGKKGAAAEPEAPAAVAPPKPVSLPPIVPPTPVAPAGKVIAPQQKKSNKLVWGIAALLVIAVLVGVTALIINQTGKSADTDAKAKAAAVAQEKSKKEAEARKAEEEQKAKEAQAKADEEAKAKKAADEKAKKEADARAAEEARKKADAEAAEAAKKAGEEKAAKELADARSASLKSLAPVLEAAAVAQSHMEKLNASLSEIDTLLAPLVALEEKEKKAQQPMIDLLTGYQSRGKALASAAEPASLALAEAKGAVEAAKSVDAAKLSAERIAALAKGQASVVEESAKWLLQWKEQQLEWRVTTLGKEAGKLPAKSKELGKANATAQVTAVQELDKRLAQRLPAIATERKAAATPDAAAVETELTRLETLDTEITGLMAEVATALAMTAESAPVVAPPTTPGTQQPGGGTAVVDADAQKKADLAALDKNVSTVLAQLKKQQDALKKKADEWKKAGNAAKEKESSDLATESDKAAKALADVQKLLKASDLANAKVAFEALKSTNNALLAQGQKVLAEKVAATAVPGGEEAAGTGAGAADKDALKSKTCPGGGMKLMIVKNSDKASAAKYIAYCIDYYEFPGAGSMPKVNVSWEAANAACAAQGKRLCKKSEWQTACGGKYPYGSTYDPEKCNTMGADGMEGSVQAAGSKASCRSPYGLYDMVGNVAEWVAEKAVAGGDAAKGGEDATCYRAASRFGASSTVGFRCCADPK